jgi:hypothetical protein
MKYIKIDKIEKKGIVRSENEMDDFSFSSEDEDIFKCYENNNTIGENENENKVNKHSDLINIQNPELDLRINGSFILPGGDNSPPLLCKSNQNSYPLYHMSTLSQEISGLTSSDTNLNNEDLKSDEKNSVRDNIEFSPFSTVFELLKQFNIPVDDNHIIEVFFFIFLKIFI